MGSFPPFLPSQSLYCSRLQATNSQTVPDTARNWTQETQAQPGGVFQGHIPHRPERPTTSSHAQNSAGNSQRAAPFSTLSGSIHRSSILTSESASQFFPRRSLSCQNQHQSDLKPNSILSPKEAFCPRPLLCNGHFVFSLKSGHCILSVLSKARSMNRELVASKINL